MIQERLKIDTRSDHEKLEELMFVRSIMDGTFSLQQYQTSLITNYLVHDVFEALLFTRLSAQMAGEIQITRRCKLPALLMDLRDLRMDTPDLAPVIIPDSFYNNDPAILGALYVLEGASLGGHVIGKKLSANPMLSHLNLNFNYYRVYGDDLIPNWKSFCAVLNRETDADYPMILAGARRMFAHFASVRQTAGLSFSPISSASSQKTLG
jgi:heme oxygenase